MIEFEYDSDRGKKLPVILCDNCGEADDVFYKYGGYVYCLDCLLRRAEDMGDIERMSAEDVFEEYESEDNTWERE